MSYEQWMAEVDLLVYSRLGCSVHDLEDFPSRAWFEDGTTPEEALEDILEQNDIDLGDNDAEDYADDDWDD